MKFVMEFFSVLFLSLTIGTSLQAAVSESSNEPTSNPISNISSSQKEMQKYMQDLRKQKPSDTVTMKKYIKTHSAYHDDYQQSEEKKSDKIAAQNNQSNTKLYTNQQYPELIPFEITDAKVPDSETLKLIEQSRERKNVEVTKENKNKVKKDMSTAESIMLKITHPGPASISNRPRSIQELPLEVQNAIKFFVQKENSQQFPSKSDKYKYPNSNKFNGDKLTSLDASKNWWAPSKPYFKPIAPLVINPKYLNNFSSIPNYTQSKQPNLLQPFPKISYFNNKFTTEPQRTSNKQTQQTEVDKLPKILYAYETEYPIYSALKQDIPNNQKHTSIISSQKLITVGDPNLVQLNSLIGKPADVQLQGLSEILEKQEKYITEKPLIRPQDSTAPHLFPLGARLPKPRPQSVKPLFIVNAVTYSTTKAPDVTTTDSYTYNDVKNHFKNNYLPYYKTKDHIPISENSPDNSPSKVIIHATPQPRSPVYLAPILLEKEKEKKKLVENIDYPSDLQYASGYAFGYRVRDSHTGNDYGHTQNRDTDGVTRGEYHIRLPDGRIQNVKYTADEKGFHADVSYQSGN